MALRARDADEVKKRKMARLRFRNVIRSVALNRIWLVDAIDQKLSLNVKKNIALIARTQRKIGLLTMAEKSLIRTHYSLRTIEERKKLVSLMAGLNCFIKIPAKVRARLSKCINFMVISPGRKLIKEGDTPAMIYFILTGEVEVSKGVFDHIQNCWVNRIEKICGPGDCLGDVELIERSKRSHTYTTTNVVELLLVLEDDFERVLRPVMEQQWTEKKIAIMALDYFKFFTSDQITSACKLCVMRQFEPLETIFYEDKGQLTYVHFVISGECMILQCLKMMVSQKRGVKSFELSDISKENVGLVFQNKSNIELINIMRGEDNSMNKYAYNVDEMIASDDESVGQLTKSGDARRSNIKDVEVRCGLIKTTENDAEKYTKSQSQASKETGSAENRLAQETETKAEHSYHQTSLNEGSVEVEDNSIVRTNKSSSNVISERKETQLETDNEANKLRLKECEASLRKSIGHSSFGSSCSAENSSPKRLTGKVENHFIDVGSLTFGGIFGLGEKFEHRVIMARTTVQCLMIPRFWLLEKDQNPGNIWQRRRFYLDTTIPSREMLYKDFLNTRQWQKIKTNLIEAHLNPESISNPTHVQDIPIICRIVEARDE